VCGLKNLQVYPNTSGFFLIEGPSMACPSLQGMVWIYLIGLTFRGSCGLHWCCMGLLSLVLSGSGLTPLWEFGPSVYPTHIFQVQCDATFSILAKTVCSLSSCWVTHPRWAHCPNGTQHQIVLLWPWSCVFENDSVLKQYQTPAYWRKKYKVYMSDIRTTV